VDDAVNCVPDTIERILHVLQAHLQQYQERKQLKLRSGSAGESGEGELMMGGAGVHTFAANNNKENAQGYMHNHGGHKVIQGIDAEILLEKEQTIQQMKETIEILELKVRKLEQLVKLKDAKIANLANKMQTAGI
jgi:hypothetical protein